MTEGNRTIVKTIKGKQYVCFNPLDCTHPEQTEVIEIIKDTYSYVIAKIDYRKKGNTCIGVRWYISDNETERCNGELCLGYPNTRSLPMWLVLPDDVLGDLHNYMLKKHIG